jgi:hypothetical protein
VRGLEARLELKLAQRECLLVLLSRVRRGKAVANGRNVDVAVGGVVGLIVGVMGVFL